MGSLLFTILIAFIGGMILHKVRIPGGMMLGSVLAVAMLSINTDYVYIPSGFRFVAQCIAGAYIGMSVKRDNFHRMKYLIKPITTLLFGLLITNFVVGILIYLTSPLDLITSFMSAVPGGISDTPLIAADLGADAAKVTILQFVRLISGIAMVPLLIRHEPVEKHRKEKEPMLVEREVSPFGNPKLWFALVVAFLAGYLGKLLGVPAGTLIFAMISVVILKMLHLEVTFPLWFKRLAQLFSGAYIGSQFSYQDFIDLKLLIIPAIIMVSLNMVTCYLMGHFLAKKYDLPLSQGILSSSPAGASDMALIASDLGVSGSDVAMIQIARLIGAVSIFPQIFYLISKLLS